MLNIIGYLLVAAASSGITYYVCRKPKKLKMNFPLRTGTGLSPDELAEVLLEHEQNDILREQAYQAAKNDELSQKLRDLNKTYCRKGYPSKTCIYAPSDINMHNGAIDSAIMSRKPSWYEKLADNIAERDAAYQAYHMQVSELFDQIAEPYAEEKRKYFQQHILSPQDPYCLICGNIRLSYNEVMSRFANLQGNKLQWYDVTTAVADFPPFADVAGVYILNNTTKRRCYVGQSQHVHQRIKQHFRGAGNGDVYVDFKTADKFKVQVVLLKDSHFETLNELERYYISYYHAYDNGYNKTVGNM